MSTISERRPPRRSVRLLPRSGSSPWHRHPPRRSWSRDGHAATSIADDSAGETLSGRAGHDEPTGPNTPLATGAHGAELYPGPGDNAFIDRPEDSFTLVDASGHALTTTGPVAGMTLGARTPATDRLYNATAATTGVGDMGSVVISPSIRPGSVSTVFHNHDSWRRTIEDLFDVSRVSRGLDGKGHIGYAARPGLAPFGADVFTDPHGRPAVHRPDRYGRIPSWLPKPPIAVGHVVGASPVHPALAIQGSAVRADLAHGSVLASAVGSAVPEEGRVPVPATSACTFTVSFSAASGVIPLRASMFVLVDKHGPARAGRCSPASSWRR